ncbi:1-phosphatidylinositol-3-phosphate 5-kinase protein [Dioscorea alata]|uniref:1-phosphatidylinositol-3-phosphate 5-kinase protein n=1 Tax=Dioscorea alata TaxID=55571 RepID=A0ACB7U7Y7_DIOAL|nr:1-phosphatidylinositol-3-phosphate 5-kinase protein [Dioscorea alata]
MKVKGVVCKKKMANRHMASKVENPRVLILGGALEYERVSHLLSSFDTLLQQEMDYLKMAVAKIDAQHPDVLLVEKSVSHFARDYILEKNISLVLNIKRPVLERIARCTGAQIVPSIDYLSPQNLGSCELFYVEKCFEEHGTAGLGGKKMTKNLIFFQGCPKPLGCTVLLKGASGDDLKKIKNVMQYGIFAAYHLAMETSFLADEGAAISSTSPITVALLDKPSSINRSISTVPGFMVSPAGGSQCSMDTQVLSMPVPKVTSDPENVKVNGDCEFAVKSESKTLFPSYTSISVSDSYHASKPINEVGFVENNELEKLRSDVQASKVDFLAPINYPDDLHTFNKDNMMTNEFSRHDYDGKNEFSLSKEEFSPPPSDHRSILVSLLTRCVWKGTVCECPHLFRIKYYGNFDKPLGRFLRDNLFDQSYQCHSCDMPSEAHVHCYTHRQGNLTISVRKLPEFLLAGEEDGKIWMWHRCLCCPRINGLPPATQRVVMSDAAWGLSFGKFLELSFSNHAAASRVASCGHSVHKECLRFYGFGNMVACFRYSSINVHSVYLPPPMLKFNYQVQEWVQKEANEVAEWAKLLFSDVMKALSQIVGMKNARGALDKNPGVLVSPRHIVELEQLLQKETIEFEESITKLSKNEVKEGQPALDILVVNKLRRQLLFQSYLWDQRLTYASNGPCEVPCDLVTTDKEKLCSTKSADCNATPQGGSTNSDANTNELLNGSTHLVDCQESLNNHLGNPKTDQQQRGNEFDSFQANQYKNNLMTIASGIDQLDPLEPDIVVHRTLSDGQFPISANLSDALDAKWTGESGLPHANALMLESSVPVEDGVPVSVSEDLEERSRGHLTQPLAHVLPTKWGDSAEDFLSWIGTPFLNIYRSLNNNWDSAPRFDALSEYKPNYVSFFREIEHQNGGRLLLPVGINDTVIPIHDDEPTSIITYALVSTGYHFQMLDDQERIKDGGDPSLSVHLYDSVTFHQFHSVDDSSSEHLSSAGPMPDDDISSLSGSRSSQVSDPPNHAEKAHIRVSFAHKGAIGKVKYTVTCYFAKRFDALRKECCPSELDFVRSLSRCKKWGAQGGKSNVFFAKSLDDRFIIKQVTKTELESFIKFGPEYFKYLLESIDMKSPTCLAKILGIYQVISKHLKSGKESRMDLLVMENLLFGRKVMRLYDLKGSSRSRYNPDSNGENRVLLDQNLIEAMPTSPIFVGNKAKRLLERAVWNDTSFLASIGVMDYSLLVGVDEENHELVLGIIDFMRKYTWDKHLETWVKTSGILGGPKNALPTVISPKQYKKRFRKAMSTYFLMVPDQWSPPSPIPDKSDPRLSEDDLQDASVSLRP